jgi:site-specific DNA-methyltransferase (adenine-specific)
MLEMDNLLNTIQNADCFNIFPQIPNDSIDLIVVDPPYGINYKEWDKFDNFTNFTEVWVRECFRVLKPAGTLWSFMGYGSIFSFVPILERYGNVHLENWVVWARQKGRGSSKHLKSQREDIFHVTKSNKFTWNNLKVLREVVCPYTKDGKPRGWFLDENGKRVRWTGLGNVWVYSAPFWGSKDDKQIHPTQKPLLLIERLVLLSSNEGDVVLDPFSGSGTTAVVCKRLKRNFICIEKDGKHYSSSIERMEREISY